MKKLTLLLSVVLLLGVVTGCDVGSNEQVVDSTSDDTTVTTDGETEEPNYGFASDRFGAMGERYVAEETEMGQYPYPEELMNATNDEIRIQRAMAKKLMQDIRYARANGIDTVYVEPGYYRFNDSLAFALDGAENLTIVGGPGVHFLQEGGQSVIYLRNCKNVTVKGVTCDYTYLSFVQATVKGFDGAGNPIVTIDENYLDTFTRLRSSLTGQRIIYFDGTDLTREKVNTIHRGFLKSFNENDDGTYTVTYNGENVLATQKPSVNVTVGDKMVVFHRSGPHAVRVSGCESVTLEDVDIYGAPGFGIAEDAEDVNSLADVNNGNNVFRRVRIIRRPGTDRLVCTSGDGFHSTNMKNGALIEKCEFSYTEDDALNYHTFLGFVTEILSDTEYQVTFPLTTLLDADAELIVFEKGSATITEITRVTDAAVLADAMTTDQKIKEATGEVVRTFNDPYVYVVKLDAPIQGVKLYDWVGSTGYSGSGLVIKDSYFHDTHGRAMTVTGPNTTISNNIVFRVPGIAVDLQRGGNWAEGPYPTGITIENNLFKENGFALEAQIKPGVIVAACNMPNLVYDIFVRNNTFVDNCVGAFCAYRATNIEFTGNTVTGFAKVMPTISGRNYMKGEGIVDGFYGLTISHCDGVVVRDNTYKKGKYAKDDVFIAQTTNLEE